MVYRWSGLQIDDLRPRLERATVQATTSIAAHVRVAVVGDPRRGGAGRGLGNLVPGTGTVKQVTLPTEEEMDAPDSELVGLYRKIPPGTLRSKSARPNPPRYGSSRGEGSRRYACTPR